MKRVAVCVALIIGWLLAPTVRAQPPAVIKDSGAFFRADTVAKATALIAAIKKKHQITIHVETFGTVPKASMDKVAKMNNKEKEAYFLAWGRERMAALKTDGLHILICRTPGYLQTSMGEVPQRLGVSDDDINSMTAKYVAQANAKKIDDGMLAALRFIDERLEFYKKNPPSLATVSERLAKVKVEIRVKTKAPPLGVTWFQDHLYVSADGLFKVDTERQMTRLLDRSIAGLNRKSNGTLLLCDNKEHALLDLTSDGQVLVLTDVYQGAKLRDLDSVTLDGDGNMYFTESDPANEKSAGRLFRLRPDGLLTLVADNLSAPRGVAIDPGNKHLFVVDAQKILRYELPVALKTPSKPSEFYLFDEARGAGCCFDSNGNLWVANVSLKTPAASQISVISSAGKLLGSLSIPANSINGFTFGGARHDELFIAASEPNGVFAARFGITGFLGHPGAKTKSLRKLDIKLLKERVD